MVMYGQTADSVPHGLSHDAGKFLILGSIAYFASIVFVVLRFLARTRTRSVSLEDWVCLAALILSTGFSINFTLQLTIGRSGYHQAQLSSSELEIYHKVSTPYLSNRCRRNSQTS